MINPNWDRWIMSSMIKNFMDQLTPTYKFLIEGQKIDPTVISGDYVQFRLNGPSIHESAKNVFHLSVEVDILVVSQMTDDFMKPRRITGDVHAAFSTNVCITKMGNGPYDDQTYLGTMILDETKKPILTTHFGQINPTQSVIFTSVSAEYCMTL